MTRRSPAIIHSHSEPSKPQHMNVDSAKSPLTVVEGFRNLRVFGAYLHDLKHLIPWELWLNGISRSFRILDVNSRTTEELPKEPAISYISKRYSPSSGMRKPLPRP